MNTPLPALFGLLWPDPRDGTGQPVDWDAIAQIATHHRLRALLHQRVVSGAIAPPPALAAQWAAAFRGRQADSLRQRSEIARLAGLLQDAGIEAILLKGAAIAWRGWFEPAIRPMRDLDLLVSAPDAQHAQRLLLASGWNGDAGPNLSNDKHLPGLTSQSGVLVEIHTHLFEPNDAAERARDAAFQQLVRDHAIRPPGAALAMSSDTDTLLHVIVHAVLDHQFNNGPLFVFDLLALLDHGAIDWGRFWANAETIGAVRAAQLSLAFAARVSPQSRIEWGAHRALGMTADMLGSVAELMLADRHQHAAVGVIGRLSRRGWRGRLGELAKGLRRIGRRPAPPAPPHAQAPQGPGWLAGSHQLGQRLDVARWLRG